MKLYRMNYMLMLIEECIAVGEVEVIREDEEAYYVLTFSPKYPVKVLKSSMTSKADFYWYAKTREEILNRALDYCNSEMETLTKRIDNLKRSVYSAELERCEYEKITKELRKRIGCEE